MGNNQELISKFSTWHQTAWVLGEKVLIALIVFFCFWIVAIILKKIILRIPSTKSHKQYVFKILADFCKITTLLLGIITALGSAGLNVSAIVASLGLSGFALGFALKDYLSNVLAGLTILIYQPFKVGDNINVSNAIGTVEEINLRYTVLTAEKQTILIPNSNMLSSTITIIRNN